MKTLLIIETINNPSASEGEALEKALNLILDYADQRRKYSKRLLKVEPCQKAYTESKFLKLLRRKVDYLHISAHGDRAGLEIGRIEEGEEIIKKGPTITPDKIKKEADIKASRVLISACGAGRREFAKAFFSDEREGIYMGPNPRAAEIDFESALLVSLSFHRGLFDKSLRAGRSISIRGHALGTGNYIYFKSPKDLKP